MAEFKTPYSEAWKNFSNSEVFKTALKRMKLVEEIEDKYLINRIQGVFDAGWNAHKESLISK